MTNPQGEQIHLIATLTAQPGLGQTLQDTMTQLASEVQQEAGCIEYTVYRANANADVVMVYEIWETQSALDAHAVGAALKPLREQSETLLAMPANLQFLTRLA